MTETNLEKEVNSATQEPKKEKPKERTYYFNKSKIAGYRKEVAKKESELDIEDLNILYAGLMNKFNEMPFPVQYRFALQVKDLLDKTAKKDENSNTTTGEQNTTDSTTVVTSDQSDKKGE